MISAATPLRKIVRVVEHIDDLEGYNILNVLQNHNLVNPTTGFFDSSLVTEAHIPILLDIINKFASEADSEMWFQYINSDRPRLGKLEDIWEYIKLRRKEAKKKPLLDYVPSPGSKSKVYEEVLNMSDEEFSYLSSLRNQESIRQASPSSHPETQVQPEGWASGKAGVEGLLPISHSVVLISICSRVPGILVISLFLGMGFKLFI